MTLLKKKDIFRIMKDARFYSATKEYKWLHTGHEFSDAWLTCIEGPEPDSYYIIRFSMMIPAWQVNVEVFKSHKNLTTVRQMTNSITMNNEGRCFAFHVKDEDFEGFVNSYPIRKYGTITREVPYIEWNRPNARITPETSYIKTMHV